MNNYAGDKIRKYLHEKNLNPEFETYNAAQLAEVLGKFYLDARSDKGDFYKSTTLENLRHSLNRYLKSSPHNKQFDIISSEDFNEANRNFKTAIEELQQSGYGSTQHHPVICDEDLIRLYMSVYLTPNTAAGLFNRVQMNIRLYFCRSTNENFEHMSKSTFAVASYPDGTRY